MTNVLKNIALGITIIVFSSFAAANEASAQTNRNCAPRDVVVERLTDKYNETRQSIGLGANNSVVEVFAADKTGTWTITATMANGLTCLVASGQNFENLNEELSPQGDPA